jgi:hypothetical protein
VINARPVGHAPEQGQFARIFLKERGGEAQKPIVYIIGRHSRRNAIYKGLGHSITPGAASASSTSA